MKKIRVLQMIPTMDIGGIETLLINILRNIDTSKVQMDFLIWCNHESYYEKEISLLGSKVYKITLTHRPYKDVNIIKSFLLNHFYDVVHCHSHFYSAFLILGAKKANVPIRISHMHANSDNYNNSFIRKIYKKICKKIMLKYSTCYCACSKEAGEYGFDNSKNVHVINNCIDVNKYLNVSFENVKELKDKYNIEKNDFVIGQVGHLTEEKNQIFTIELIEKLVKQHNFKKIKCLFIGEGQKKKDLERQIAEKNLNDYFIFTGAVNNVAEHLNLLDIFLFPSLYEGFGMALVEAQAAGIYSLSSNNVPSTTDMELNLVKYLPINNHELWINEVLNYKKIEINSEKIKSNILNKGFDIEYTINQLMELYFLNFKGDKNDI